MRKYTVNFHITHQCNMRCSYCYAGDKLNVSMSDIVIADAINFIAKEVIEKKIDKLVVAFLGGEPLIMIDKIFSIQDELFKIIGSEVDVLCQLSTNCLLLNDELMYEITSRGILVSLSIDGTPETMQRQRPLVGNSDYSKLIDRAISSVLKHNPFTNAFCVVTP